MNIKEDHEALESLGNKIKNDLENGDLDLDDYTTFETKLKDHIYVEETLIFPELLKNNDVRDLITGLKVEHGSFWMLMNKIDNDIETKTYWNVKKTLEEIFLIMHNHDQIEERGIDAIMLHREISVSSRRPGNWQCEKAPSRVK